MLAEDEIRKRIEVRVSQGEFLGGMLHLARGPSAQAHGGFVDQLCRIAATLREIFDANGWIRRFEYRPAAFWAERRGSAITFLDGGVANIDLPSAAPIGIRVGSYTVRPGERDLNKRETFSIDLSIIDDLYSDDGYLYDSDFTDVAKLRDAARIISETAAVLHATQRDSRPNAIFLHGPLINPASPYGLDDFPAYGLEACRVMMGDPSWEGSENDRHFVAFYLALLQAIESSGAVAVGVVERAIGRDPVVLKEILKSLQADGIARKDDVRKIIEEVRVYGLNDASIFDVVLQAGEYIRPLPVERQGPEGKWPEIWKPWIREYPPALTTYLKPTELTTPFRVETFKGGLGFEEALDLVLHTSRLLPSYGFPVGLDIVDKFAKVPEWMSRGIRSQHQVVLLQKALASGDPRALTFAKRVLTAKGRDWFFRPEA